MSIYNDTCVNFRQGAGDSKLLIDAPKQVKFQRWKTSKITDDPLEEELKEDPGRQPTMETMEENTYQNIRFKNREIGSERDEKDLDDLEGGIFM